jgi:uncharacterized protein (DUF58 family)
VIAVADSAPALSFAALRARLALWLRPRRRLRATGAGRALIAMSFAVGFAAFNTGNNLLFFGWGLLLSSIIVSGILSEATLQAVSLEPRAPGELRARMSGVLPFFVSNRRRVPAFAVEVQALIDGGAGAGAASGPSHDGAAPRSFELRLEPGARRGVDLSFVPPRRGTLRVSTARALTAFPFGFFEKEKRIVLDPPLEVVVLPRRLEVLGAARDLLTRLGESPARRAGPGDELFSLRPFRAGDDPRRIAWRRAARTNRLIVRETEAARSRDIVLELVVAGGVAPADLDHAIDVAGTLAEDLLAAGHAVGLRAPGVALPAAHGPRQRSALLTSLALVDARAALPDAPPGRAAVVAVVARGASAAGAPAAVVEAATVPGGPA